MGEPSYENQRKLIKHNRYNPYIAQLYQKYQSYSSILYCIIIVHTSLCVLLAVK